MSPISHLPSRALALVSAGLLAGLATATGAEASPAPTADITIIDAYTETVQESAGTAVLCPTNQVLVGRRHIGDSDGYTTYYCAFVLIGGQPAKVSSATWSDSQTESSSSFTATPPYRVLVGQQHTGDATGSTRYAYATMRAWGQPVALTNYGWTPAQRESSSYSHAGTYEVMVGRSHYGDENGPTRYQYAAVSD
ncbi:hypothetical protein [Streptomyces sp. NPDC086787]|uniref:hypothetical protein n=1 Tax=Streptomyces sp. NPDC086787 TaxID=3365759 RepID=UPI003801FC3A